MEELEEELKKKEGTEREDQCEGIHQISDQSVHKRLRKMHSKQYGDGPTNGRTNQWTDQRTDVVCYSGACMHLEIKKQICNGGKVKAALWG
jgi:hypothetical protein